MFVKSKVDPVRVETEKKNLNSLASTFDRIKDQDLVLSQRKKDAVGNEMQKRYEDENVELVVGLAIINQQKLNRLERDVNIQRSKLNELESLREMNLRYLLDEATQNAKLVRDNEWLQNEIDFKTKMDEEDRREIVAETEFKNLRVLQNQVKYDQERTTAMLDMLRDE